MWVNPNSTCQHIYHVNNHSFTRSSVHPRCWSSESCYGPVCLISELSVLQVKPVHTQFVVTMLILTMTATHRVGISEGVVLLQPCRSRLSSLCHRWILKQTDHVEVNNSQKQTEYLRLSALPAAGVSSVWIKGLRVTTLHYCATSGPNSLSIHHQQAYNSIVAKTGWFQ